MLENLRHFMFYREKYNSYRHKTHMGGEIELSSFIWYQGCFYSFFQFIRIWPGMRQSAEQCSISLIDSNSVCNVANFAFHEIFLYLRCLNC